MERVRWGARWVDCDGALAHTEILTPRRQAAPPDSEPHLGTRWAPTGDAPPLCARAVCELAELAAPNAKTDSFPVAPLPDEIFALTLLHT